MSKLERISKDVPKLERDDLFERIAAEASKLAHYNKRLGHTVRMSAEVCPEASPKI